MQAEPHQACTGLVLLPESGTLVLKVKKCLLELQMERPRSSKTGASLFLHDREACSAILNFIAYFVHFLHIAFLLPMVLLDQKRSIPRVGALQGSQCEIGFTARASEFHVKGKTFCQHFSALGTTNLG